ncbi:MAG: FHA domain-containing protein [Desulfobacteraceae bacterium]|jgi:adenylate cyclase
MPELHVIEGPQKGQTIAFSGDTVFVGRSSTNDLQIFDSSISRKHIKLFRLENLVFVEDLKSTNGTLVNGEPIEPGEGVQVGEGDTISLGHTTIRLGTISEDEVIAIKDVAPPSTKRAPDAEPRLTEERRSRTRKELELICKVSELIQEPFEIKEVLEEVLGLLFQSLPRIDRAAIFLVDKRKGQIKKYFTKSRQEQVDETAPYSQAVVDLVLKGGKALKMSMETDGTMTPLSESWETLRIRSVMCVPMRSRSRLCGLLYVEGLREYQAFREEDLLLLKGLSGLLALAIEGA